MTKPYDPEYYNKNREKMREAQKKYRLKKLALRKGLKSEDIRNLKTAKAIITSNSLTEAYLKVHPDASHDTASKNQLNILTPEVVEEVRRILQLEKLAETTRDNIEKMFYSVILLFHKGDTRVKAADFIRALENLKELVPDFKKRHEIDDISRKSPEEIDEELKKYGVNFGD